MDYDLARLFDRSCFVRALIAVNVGQRKDRLRRAPARRGNRLQQLVVDFLVEPGIRRMRHFERGRIRRWLWLREDRGVTVC